MSRIYRKSTLRWKAHHSGCGYMWTWDDLKNSQMWTPPSTPATGLLDKTYLQNIVKLFICQIFWLEYIWLKQVGWPLNHCFKASKNPKLLYHRPVLLNLVEQSLLTSSTDFCWKKLLYHALHFTNTITKYVKYQLSTMWNTK